MLFFLTMLLALTLVSFGASILLTWIVLHYLRKQQILDIPNARSNHTFPTPRGGGIAYSLVILISWLVIAPAYWPVVAGGIVLAIVSFIDDKKGLSARVRVLVQGIAILLGMITLYSGKQQILPILPLWLEIGMVTLAWLWFINLYNFMDGIDGITSAETIAICIGLLLIGIAKPALAALVIGAMLGFLWWNWHPAKIFSGDVGSIPLGFLLGFLLIQLAQSGYLVQALILPLYYLADSTYTLFKRLLRGEKIWEAHSEHFYQQAVRQGGKRHSQVVLIITVLNLMLIGLALLPLHTSFWPFGALVVSLLAVIVVLRTQLRSQG